MKAPRKDIKRFCDKRRYHELKSMGLCPKCRKPVTGKFSLCLPCRKTSSARKRAKTAQRPRPAPSNRLAVPAPTGSTENWRRQKRKEWNAVITALKVFATHEPYLPVDMPSIWAKAMGIKAALKARWNPGAPHSHE